MESIVTNGSKRFELQESLTQSFYQAPGKAFLAFYVVSAVRVWIASSDSLYPKAYFEPSFEQLPSLIIILEGDHGILAHDSIRMALQPILIPQ